MQAKSIVGFAFFLSIGAGLTPSLALAADEPGARSLGRFERLKSLDGDRDGAVTGEEFAVEQRERFAKRDVDKDGKLSGGELVAVGRRGGKPEDRATRLLKRYDTNGDGRATREEHEAGERAWFSRRDKDGDGKLSFSEQPRRFMRRGAKNEVRTLDKALERAAERFKLLDANADGAFDVAEIVAAEQGRRDYREKRALHRLDKDRDGHVSLEEYLAQSRERFWILDLDSDGKITAADLPPDVRAGWSGGQAAAAK